MRCLSAIALILSLTVAQAGFAKDCKLTVYFGLNQDQLTPDMQQVLLTFLAHNPHAYGNVIGHTDALASQAYNMDLSKRRAMTVVNFIEQYRANSVSLGTDWRGKMNLVVNSPSAEPMNRRVEIYFRNCANFGFFQPMPQMLRGYQTSDSDDDHVEHHEEWEPEHHEHEEEPSSAAASAGHGRTSTSGTGDEVAAAASAGVKGVSTTVVGNGCALAASAGKGRTSVSSAGNC